MNEPVEPVAYSVTDGVAVLVATLPPVNAATPEMRAALMAALDRAELDAAVRAVVLAGSGDGFVTGPAMSELANGFAAPTPAALSARIEDFPKPVVAAMHGMALGCGFEIALAAHYRVAIRGAVAGLPDVRLGVVPCAGATQRAPRLVGAALSLSMMLSGRMVPLDRAPGSAFVDVVAEGDAPQTGLRFARHMLAEQLGPRPTRDRGEGFADPAAYQAEVAAQRERLKRAPEMAPREILTAVEAAMLMPFAAGMALEETAFEDCRLSEQSASLRRAMRAEHDARQVASSVAAGHPGPERICVLGGSALGTQAAAAALIAGCAVDLVARDDIRIEDAESRLRALFDEAVETGALTAKQVSAALSLLSPHGPDDPARDAAPVVLIGAAGQADIDLPATVLRVPLFPGTVSRLAMRFSSPVHRTRLVEVLCGPEAGNDDIALALGVARRLDRVPVIVRSEGETVAARLMVALQRAADGLVDRGATPYAVDAALRDWGWLRPPFEIRDLLGLGAMDGAPRGAGATNWSRLLAEAGRSGQAGGVGFYLWPENAAAQPDPDLATLIDAHRTPRADPARLGLARLLVGAVANEGARMIEEGVVQRPADIDLVAMHGLGFPRWRGGPMMAASQFGLLATSRAMTQLGHSDTAFWTPRPVFGELIKNGRGFETLDG